MTDNYELFCTKCLAEPRVPGMQWGAACFRLADVEFARQKNRRVTPKMLRRVEHNMRGDLFVVTAPDEAPEAAPDIERTLPFPPPRQS
jgi:hypothetical protein